MPMCLLQTLLRIHHVYALEYDKPWLIEHYIQICSCLAIGYSMLHISIFYEILETDMVFFADSNYVVFNKNIFFSILFLCILCHNSSTQKTHY